MILPISLWGSIEYVKVLNVHKNICLDIHEHFPKQTHRNRFELTGIAGRMSLTLPVIKAQGSKTATGDVEITSDKNERLKLWRTLTANYASSPYFDHYESDLKTLFLQPNENLAQHTLDVIQFLSEVWSLNLEISFTTSFHPYTTDDIRLHDFLGEREMNVYTQVLFDSTSEFKSNLSILDLLLNEGPMGKKFL